MSAKKIDFSSVTGMVGNVPDAEIAKILACSIETVRRHRVGRGIRPLVNSQSVRPAVSGVAPFAYLLGTMPDAQIARKSGCSIVAVANYRRSKGIATFVVPAAHVADNTPPAARVPEASVDRSDAFPAPAATLPEPEPSALVELLTFEVTFFSSRDSTHRRLTIAGRSLTQVSEAAEAEAVRCGEIVDNIVRKPLVYLAET